MNPGVQADVRRVTHDGRDCILKSPKSGFFHVLSKKLLRREFHIYERLKGVDGIPACHGWSDDGLILEAVSGKPLSEFRRGEISVEFLDTLDRIITGIHARGVAHSDLKKRENIIVSDQSPVVLDFGAAFLRGEILFETFRKIDLAAAAKLRAHHQPETLRPEQRHILDHPTWAERLSRFLIRIIRDPYRKLTA